MSGREHAYTTPQNTIRIFPPPPSKHRRDPQLAFYSKLKHSLTRAYALPSLHHPQDAHLQSAPQPKPVFGYLFAVSIGFIPSRFLPIVLQTINWLSIMWWNYIDGTANFSQAVYYCQVPCRNSAARGQSAKQMVRNHYHLEWNPNIAWNLKKNTFYELQKTSRPWVSSSKISCRISKWILQHQRLTW